METEVPIDDKQKVLEGPVSEFRRKAQAENAERLKDLQDRVLAKMHSLETNLPLSEEEADRQVQEAFVERQFLYKHFADFEVVNDASQEKCLNKILDLIHQKL